MAALEASKVELRNLEQMDVSTEKADTKKLIMTMVSNSITAMDRDLSATSSVGYRDKWKRDKRKRQQTKERQTEERQTEETTNGRECQTKDSVKRKRVTNRKEDKRKRVTNGREF